MAPCLLPSFFWSCWQRVSAVRYISFVSQTIYQESTSHLEEVLHKSNNMLKEMVRKNLTYLHLYNGFLESYLG